MLRQDAAVRQALFRAAHMEVSLRRILAQPEADRPVTLPVPAGRAGSWRRIARYAALALATAGGWIGAVFFAHQYRVLRNEHAAALQTIAALEARPAEAARPVGTRSGRLSLLRLREQRTARYGPGD